MKIEDLSFEKEFCWSHDKTRTLVYLGRDFSNGVWYQFALKTNPNKVWCEVRESDLRMLEVRNP